MNGNYAREGLGTFTMRQMVKNVAMLYKDSIAMQIKRGEKYEKVTYHQLKKKVESLGSMWLDMGLKPGDRIAVLGENRPEWGISYLSVTCAGGTVVPLDPKIKPEKWRHILDDSESKFIVTTNQFIDDILAVSRKVKSLKKVICMDKRVDLPKVLYWKTLIDDGWTLIKNGKSKYEQQSVELDHLAAILYTSGTTGTSKGVMLTHRNIMSNVDSSYRILDYGPDDTFLSVLPLHHTFEATAGFLVPIYGGAAITYSKSLKSRDIMEGIRETKVTIMVGVPLLYEKLLEGIRRKVKTKPKRTQFMFNASMKLVKATKKLTGQNLGKKVFKGLRKKGGLESMRLLVSGGAPLPPEVEIGFRNLGINLVQGYGLTETSPVLALNPLDHPKPGSIGIAYPGIKLKIYQPNEEGVGEIIAKGDNVMKGYYKNEEATAEIIDEDGWLHTGDLGKMDDDRYFYITGRAKNLIVSKGGKNIYPEEIEMELMKSPYIEEALIVGALDTKTNREIVHAIIFPNYEEVDFYAKRHKISRMSEEEVYKLIKSEISKQCKNLASYKRVENFEIREEEFEKTTTRKIKRYLFKREHVSVYNSKNK